MWSILQHRSWSLSSEEALLCFPPWSCFRPRSEETSGTNLRCEILQYQISGLVVGSYVKVHNLFGSIRCPQSISCFFISLSQCGAFYDHSNHRGSRKMSLISDCSDTIKQKGIVSTFSAMVFLMQTTPRSCFTALKPGWFVELSLSLVRHFFASRARALVKRKESLVPGVFWFNFVHSRVHFLLMAIKHRGVRTSCCQLNLRTEELNDFCLARCITFIVFSLLFILRQSQRKRLHNAQGSHRLWKTWTFEKTFSSCQKVKFQPNSGKSEGKWKIIWKTQK